MSDEMPNTIFAGYFGGRTMWGQWTDETHPDNAKYILIDWLRSQIEGMRKPYPTDAAEEECGIFDDGMIYGRNAALDQILKLLETGEKNGR